MAGALGFIGIVVVGFGAQVTPAQGEGQIDGCMIGFAGTGTLVCERVNQDLSARVPTLERMKTDSLRRVREDVETLKTNRAVVAMKTGLGDYRCVIHAHSYLSHDSRGTIADIAAAAKQARVDAVFLTNHPKPDEDVVAKGQHEPVEGVLFAAGAETDGFLAFPGDRKLPALSVADQQLVKSIRSTGGLVFVAHPEQRTDWSLTDLTGTEIYNTHADLNDETALLQALQPKDAAGYGRLLSILNAVRDYPRETFASINDPPLKVLARYDALCRDRVYAAVAGNDSHQNTGFVLKGMEDQKISVEDPLGERIGILDAKKNPVLSTLFGTPDPGKEMMRRVLDPYAVSFGYVSTHVLAKERGIEPLKQALREGRTYVAFDWLADPTGTVFIARSGGSRWNIGGSAPLRANLVLAAEVPLPCRLLIIKDGHEAARSEGRTIEYRPTEPGVYRLEAHLVVGGELRPWIYTSAIRITRPAAAYVGSKRLLLRGDQ